MAQGPLSQLDLRQNINWLELRAVHLALQSFRDLVLCQDVLVLMDSVSTKAQVHESSKALMQETLRLGLGADTHLRSVECSSRLPQPGPS